MKSRQAELNEAVLRYITRCIDEDDPLDLRRTLDLPSDLVTQLIHEIPNLRLADLRRFSRTHALLVQPRVNGNALRQLLEIIHSDRIQERNMTILLRHDASYEMLASLFGMDRLEYARLRRLHGISSTGRTPSASADQERRLSAVLTEHGIGVEELVTMRNPDVWLELTDRIGIRLRTLWRLVQQWGASS